MQQKRSRIAVWMLRLISTVALTGFIIVLVRLRPTGEPETLAAEPRTKNAATSESTVQVEVASPHKGGIPRTYSTPGSVHAFDDADLYAQVSGYLSELKVDIGSMVEKGQLLARIDVPELVQEVVAAKATVQQKKANVKQAEAKVDVAKADKETADAAVEREKAALKRDKARKVFNDRRLERFQGLKSENAINQGLVDEKEDQWEAAVAAVDAAEAALKASEVNVIAATARIGQAIADVGVAEAELDMAKADLAKAEVKRNFGDIVSPYKGVITVRNVHVGYFIRDAQSGGNVPLLRVERIDKMRVVIPMPDIHVPYTNIGDRAEIQIDALPGRVFHGTVKRFANSEDHETRTMRTEIDLENENNLLRDGMYGHVTVILQENTDGWTIPSSALVGKVGEGKGEIYVVTEGVAHRQVVQVGTDTGRLVEILAGVDAQSQVVTRYRGAIGDNIPVHVTLASPPKAE